MMNVLELFEATVARFPEKTACAYRDERYSFAELYAQAQRAGNALRAFGMRDRPVGVIADRGIRTLAMFFGVLYSGNYYVPIDPDMPAAKKQAIFEDSQMRVVCGLAEHAAEVSTLAGQAAYLTAEQLFAAEGEELPVPEAGGDDPLYMVYTSGSTGKPKGVLKSHRAELSFIEAYRETFGFTEAEIIGNQTPFYFDASAKDIYMMAGIGCTIEILPTTLFTLPPELIDYLNQKQVTFASWVPTVLSLVAQLNPFSVVKPTTLKRIFFVGEVMPMKHLNKWRAALPDIQYVNLYGQSEIAGVCCWYEVKGEFDNAATLPMGQPLKNCRIYLVDNGEVVTGANRVGEMYIVSDALATEYFNDGQKTADCFLRRDFGEGEVRCFRTGDLAQYDSEGNLLFASRTDFQIKHMGHRIELGEIEAVAGALPEIARCCCLYQKEKQKLILYCQLGEGVQKTPQEIRSALRERLSAYMVPGRVIVMDRLPISPNGKIDRQALKALL